MNQKILIAEDEADIRSILRLYLESEGYAVIETDNGEDALFMVCDHMPPAQEDFEEAETVRE